METSKFRKHAKCPNATETICTGCFPKNTQSWVTFPEWMTSLLEHLNGVDSAEKPYYRLCCRVRVT